jgi:hypothetical protein
VGPAILRSNRYEFFRAASLFVALEHHKSIDEALAHISDGISTLTNAPAAIEALAAESIRTYGIKALPCGMWGCAEQKLRSVSRGQHDEHMHSTCPPAVVSRDKNGKSRF